MEVAKFYQNSAATEFYVYVSGWTGTADSYTIKIPKVISGMSTGASYITMTIPLLNSLTEIGWDGTSYGYIDEIIPFSTSSLSQNPITKVNLQTMVLLRKLAIKKVEDGDWN